MEIKCCFRYETLNNCLTYGCVVNEAAVVSPNTKIRKIFGEHLPGKTRYGVQAIEFKGTVVEYFPRGLHRIFPFLRSVTIDKCGLQSITRDDLVGLENLEEITVINNRISWLPSNLFVGFSKLKRINFSANKIQCLSSKMLEVLESNQLEKVIFTGNTQINKFFDPALSGSTALEDLIKIIDKDCGEPDESEISDELLAKQEFCQMFNAGFQSLWITKRYSDFTITVAGRNKPVEFKVHKNVLASQSPVFATIFDSDMKEKKLGVMHIEDFNVATVEDFSQFMYTGVIKDERNSIELCAIATKYEVKLLKERSEKIVLSHIDQINAIDVFCFGYMHNSEKIKRAAFNEIKKMLPHKDLDNSLLENPETLKKLVAAVRKIQDGQEEIDDLIEY